MTREDSRYAWVLALACCACNGSQENAAPAAASASSAPHPIDHLAKGELAQGTEKVFGLAIPRKMRVERRFLDAAHAVGPVSP
ncbi:MAG: hypothetical protein KC766_05515, partial [Myxococcales bacterium]|nr:hypothetical protein [Myxococcales bacterium]